MLAQQHQVFALMQAVHQLYEEPQSHLQFHWRPLPGSPPELVQQRQAYVLMQAVWQLCGQLQSQV